MEGKYRKEDIDTTLKVREVASVVRHGSDIFEVIANFYINHLVLSHHEWVAITIWTKCITKHLDVCGDRLISSVPDLAVLSSKVSLLLSIVASSLNSVNKVNLAHPAVW